MNMEGSFCIIIEGGDRKCAYLKIIVSYVELILYQVLNEREKDSMLKLSGPLRLLQGVHILYLVLGAFTCNLGRVIF